MTRLGVLLSAGVFVALVGGCGHEQSTPTAPTPSSSSAAAGAAATPAAASTQPTTVFKPVPNQAALHNAHYVTNKVISGAQPEGDASFAYLKELGVKTIISVDGSAPDAETAHRFGLAYVHLPISYAGVTPEQGKLIAKAIDEKPGLIYLHCHHGKHRSAAAVAVACVYDGYLKPEQAEDVLKTFGTGENYKGLWKAASDARPLDLAEIRNLKVEWVEHAKIDDLASMMVDTDQRLDNLKAAQKAGWKAPAGQPQIEPAHEALMLQELLHEMLRTGPAQTKPADFAQLGHDADAAATLLHEVLAAKPIDMAKADAAMKTATASCLACHKTYRD